MRVIHLLCVALVVWCVEGTFALNTNPSTGGQGAKRSCAFVPVTSEAAWISLQAVKIFFFAGL